MSYQNIIEEKLLPAGTSRRKLYDLFLKSFGIAVNEGFESLWQNYRLRRNINRQIREHLKISGKLQVPALEKWNGRKIIFPVHSENPDVSIIIPVHNNSIYTFNCLNSIFKNSEGSFEVIVINDASDDDTSNLLMNMGNIKVIKNDENKGFVESCNIGAKSATGKYLFFLNNDTLVTENWFKPLINAMSIKDVGAVGVKLIYPNGKLQEAGGIIWNDASCWNYGRYDDPEKPQYNFIREVDYCSGAALIVRKDLFEKLGGFDKTFKPGYYEDTDLCFSIRRSGYKVLFQPKCFIFHFEGATGGIDIKTGVKKYQGINKSKFYDKWKDLLKKEQYPPEPANLLFHARNRKKGKNILIIDRYIPTFDKDSGSYRMYNITRILNDLGHKVTFIGDNLMRLEPYTAELQQYSTEVLYAPYIKSVKDFLVLEGKFFDVVIISRSDVAAKHVSYVKKYCSKAKKILDTVDMQFLRETRRAELYNDKYLLKKANAIKKKELDLSNEFDLTLVVSPVEKEVLLKEEPFLIVEILSNIHEIYAPENPFSRRKYLMFLGGFDHSPNIDAVKYFVNEILQYIRKEIPDIKIYIVGSNPPEEIQLLKSENIKVTGYVKDLKPYFENCRVFVAPLRYGAGVKGKIGEAMAHGVPVITTSVGAEGMNLENGENTFISDEPERFAENVLKVYKDNILWDKISGNSIKHVQKYYSFEENKIIINKIINDMVIN